MSSEPVQTDGDLPPTFRQTRLPINKLKYAIEEGKNLIAAIDSEMDRIQEISNQGGFAYSKLAGDLAWRSSEYRTRIEALEKRERSFGVIKYFHCGKEPRILLKRCGQSLSSAKSVSETVLRMWELTQQSAHPGGSTAQSSNPPDRPGDDDNGDCVSSPSTTWYPNGPKLTLPTVNTAKSTSSCNAADYSSLLPHRPIIIKAKQVSLSFHDSHTTVRGITLGGPNADGFTFNCHTTESRGSMHNNMQFPPSSASEAPTPESATPGSGV